MSEEGRQSGVPAPRPAVVLVVDDDETVLAVSRHILARHGYTVLEAPGGDEALHVARTYAHRIDILLTDVRMPGLDGLSLARRLIDMMPDLRVVYMSGYVDERVDDGLPPPPHDFITKPFTAMQLTGTLASLLALLP